jgi:hypothetical protein
MKDRREEHRKYQREHREEARERTRLWRKAHPGGTETIRQGIKRYQKANHDHILEVRRKYDAKHREEIAERRRKEYAEDPGKFLARCLKYSEKNRERARERSREWRLKNPGRHNILKNEWQKRRDRDNPGYRVPWSAVSRMIQEKTASVRTRQLIGCSPGFLRNHLESLFKPGMTWENYGEWHVDHIVPISWFPFKKDSSLVFVASHWTNLQPLWATENLAKGNRRAA